MNSYQVYGDWGTTRLRLWRVEGGAVTATHAGPGIGQLSGDPADVLRAAIGVLTPTQAPRRIVLCGMAGARNGMHEVPYAECPVGVAGWRKAAIDLSFDEASLRIAPGVSCREEDRPDVMRGEETQIFGAMRLDPELSHDRHVLVLPGTHSKWVTVDDGRISGFRTFLSGEMFALLQGSSLLAAGRESDAADYVDGFEAGLARASDGKGLLGNLFEARAAQLCDGRSAKWGNDFISGLLIASEIAEMDRREQLPRELHVIGGAELAERYTRAFARWNVTAIPLAGDACALAGLELLDADD